MKPDVPVDPRKETGEVPVVNRQKASAMDLGQAYGSGGLRDELDRLDAERDDLLEAMKRIAFEPFGPSDATSAQVLELITVFARSVVARAEGNGPSALTIEAAKREGRGP